MVPPSPLFFLLDSVKLCLPSGLCHSVCLRFLLARVRGMELMPFFKKLTRHPLTVQGGAALPLALRIDPCGSVAVSMETIRLDNT